MAERKRGFIKLSKKFNAVIDVTELKLRPVLIGTNFGRDFRIVPNVENERGCTMS
jgi:hypothetical protein